MTPVRRRRPTATASAATAGEQPSAAPEATASRGAKLKSIGRFTSPVYVTSPPQDRQRVFVVEQGGRIMVVGGGRKRSRSSTSAARCSPGGEQGLLSVAFAPDYAQLAPLLRLLHRPLRRPARGRVPARDSATRADAGSARARPAHEPTPRATTTAACCCSGPTGTSTSAPATAAARATSTARAATHRTWRRCSARSCASTRGCPARPALHASPPTTRSAAAAAPAARSTATACATRGASRSTAAPATSSIGDVGQNAVEEIDFVRRGKGARRELRLAPVRGRARATPRARTRPATSRP